MWYVDKPPCKFKLFNAKYLVMQGGEINNNLFNCKKGLLLSLSDDDVMNSLNYF